MDEWDRSRMRYFAFGPGVLNRRLEWRGTSVNLIAVFLKCKCPDDIFTDFVVAYYYVSPA
jgi:hypothetical protein